MDINVEMIDDAISELFHYRVPKRLAEYWNEQYAGTVPASHIKNWAELSRVLKSEYETYSIGIRDSMDQHEITCSQCMAKNRYFRETGYRLVLEPHGT